MKATYEELLAQNRSLAARVQELERERDEAQRRNALLEEYQKRCEGIEDNLANAINDYENAGQQVARLREALQVLHDEQNDAPLENRRQQWQAAMTLASDALREAGAYQEVKKTT